MNENNYGTQPLATLDENNQEKKKAFCGNCGAEILEGIAFCNKCGAPTQYYEIEKICQKCNSIVSGDSEFCSKCGTKYSQENNIVKTKSTKLPIIIAGTVVLVIAAVIAIILLTAKTPVEDVVLAKNSVELKIGESDVIACTVYPSDASNKNVIWSSSDNNIASVNENGMIIAVGEGSCTVTATVDGISSDISVTVKKKTLDLKAIYDEFCQSTWADLGNDNSYLHVDTNPYNYDDGDSRYVLVVNTAIEKINAKMGLPASLYNDMNQTSWSMGKQSETFDSVGITVSWTYHPDKGLEVTYKLIND